MKTKMKELRESQEISLQFISRLIGVSTQELERVESDFNEKDMPVLELYAKMFGVGVEFLIEKDNNLPSGDLTDRDQREINKLIALSRRFNKVNKQGE